jgi:hypothetical protein
VSSLPALLVRVVLGAVAWAWSGKLVSLSVRGHDKVCGVLACVYCCCSPDSYSGLRAVKRTLQVTEADAEVVASTRLEARTLEELLGFFGDFVHARNAIMRLIDQTSQADMVEAAGGHPARERRRRMAEVYVARVSPETDPAELSLTQLVMGALSQLIDTWAEEFRATTDFQHRAMHLTSAKLESAINSRDIRVLDSDMKQIVDKLSTFGVGVGVQRDKGDDLKLGGNRKKRGGSSSGDDFDTAL